MLRRLLFLLMMLGCAERGFASIAFDNAVDGGDNGGITNSLTFNSASVSGSNRVGFVGCLGDNITAGVDDLTGITWNAVSGSLVAKYTTPDIALDRNTYLYFFNAIPTGVTSIVVSASTTHYLLCAEVSYNGVKQSGNPVEFVVNSGGSNLTTMITTSVDNSWAIILAQCGGCTASAGVTRRTGSTTFNNFLIGDSNSAIHPAGTYSMEVDGSTVGAIQIVVSVQPDTGGGGSAPPSLTLTGVGH